MTKKRRRKAALMPRLGPPSNLRPAGAHETLTKYNRKRHKAALRRDAGYEPSETDYNVE